jgi:hypothetical protein
MKRLRKIGDVYYAMKQGSTPPPCPSGFERLETDPWAFRLKQPEPKPVEESEEADL